MEKLILVDESDCETGEMEKMDVHLKGALHRAFSIFVFKNNKLLLQQRALSKYHSGGLWTNTCCGHPKSQEKLEDAVHRRLFEEMGFDCPLQEKFSFRYTASLDHSLIENEYDHIYFGEFQEEPIPNPMEVMDYKWIDWNEVCLQVKNSPEIFTYWFKIAVEKIIDHGIPI